MQPSNSFNFKNLSDPAISDHAYATTTTPTPTTITTSITPSTSTTLPLLATPPRLEIKGLINNPLGLSVSPDSPRRLLSPRAIPVSPRSLSPRSPRSNPSSREIHVETINSDKKSTDVVPVSISAPNSQSEKNNDNPPPYSLIDALAQPSSPSKLTINFHDLEKNDNEKNETQQHSEPLLTPRRNRITRHTAALRRNPTDSTGQVNNTAPTSPRAVFASPHITPVYSREKIISSLSTAITKFAIGKKPANLDIIRSIGRADAVIDIDELPVELRSLCENQVNKKISLSKLMRDLFFSEFISGASWLKAKQFIIGAKLMNEKSIVNIGETDEKIKNEKLLIIKPVAEDIALCLIGNKGLIANMALPAEFTKNFLFQADQKILEWALNSESLGIKEVNLARCSFLYNLVVIRFIQPIITAEFGDCPSQMNIWMQDLIMSELHKNIHSVFKDFLGESGKLMPEKLNSWLNTRADLELRNKRIAEIKKNNSKIKEKNYKFSEKEVLKTKEKNKLINAERSNLSMLKEIKEKCGIANIQGKFSDYIEADIKKWLSLDLKMDRESIILNLNFAVYNYLENHGSEIDTDGNILAIKNASNILEKLSNANFSDDLKRHTTFIDEDLTSMLDQNLIKFESESNLIDGNKSEDTNSTSPIKFDADKPVVAVSSTNLSITATVVVPTSTDTVTDIDNFVSTDNVAMIDANFKERRN